MHHYFFAIHRFVDRNKALSVGLALLMLLVFGFFASQLKFEEDITKLIPINAKSGVTAKILKQLNFADKVTVIFETAKSGAAEDLQQSANVFLDSLERSCKPYFNSVQGKVDDENIQQTIDFVYNNLPLFLDEADYVKIQQKIATDSVAETVKGNYKSILSPSGIVTTDFIQRDPFGISFIALKKLQQLSIGDDFTLDNGFVMTKDKKTLLLFITPNQSSSETEKNTLFSEKLYSIKAHLDRQFSGKAKLSYFGPALIAVANAKQIKGDIQFTTMIAMTSLMLILILFYRKVYIPLVIFLPTVFGALFALAFLFFVKETISAISLGIGAILIGITIDYSLHIMTHYKHNSDLKTLYKDITKPLFMSSSTTALAFLCLLFVKSEALNDLGIFAAAIVMGSAFFSMLIVPHLYKPKHDNFGHKKNFIDRMAAFSFDNNKWLIGGCAVIIVVCCFTFTKVHFNNDLSQLNFVPKDIQAAEKQLEKSSSLTSKTIYLASYGNSMDEALQHNRRLFSELGKQKSGHKIINFSSVGGLVLSKAQQKEKIDRWNAFWDQGKKRALKAALISEGQKIGFKPTTYTPFFEQLDKTFHVLSISDYTNIQALQLKEFVTGKHGFYTVSTLVKVSGKQRDAFVKSVSTEKNIIAIDRQQMNETFLGQLRDDFNILVNYSFIAVILVLFVFFRRIELVLISSIPIGLTGIVTAGIMGIFGIEFNIFSTIVCTLIFGHGVDFSIFMTSALQKEYTNGKDEMQLYRTSIILAAMTTVLGVGALIFAGHPSLKSISLVSLIGVFAAIIMSFIFYPILFRRFFFSRVKKGKAPLELRRTIHSVLSFSYYGLGGFLLSIFSVTMMKIVPMGKEKKLRIFHYLMSKFMHSVLLTYPSAKKKIVNPNGETFDKPAIIIANHSSFLDILAMGSLSPKIVFLVSDWVYNSPVIGKGVRLAGFYPVSNGIGNGVEHLREKVKQGFSLMVFPEGTRSPDNTIRRFHKGAFYLAEEFRLDILPVIIHGYSEVAPKGDFILNGFPTTVEIGERISANDKRFGNDYAERTKKINAFMRERYRQLRQKLEGPDYFKKTVLNSFDYKEHEVTSVVKKDIDENIGLYSRVGQNISAKARILHIADDFGQLDVLLAFQEPLRKIDSFIAEEEKRSVAQTSYVLKKRAIHYIGLEDMVGKRYDVSLISAKEADADAISMLSNTVILLDNESLSPIFARLGFVISHEEEKIIVLEKP
jgi:1-acyl-sn-glycerol-3-phosphate acyltransferase